MGQFEKTLIKLCEGSGDTIRSACIAAGENYKSVNALLKRRSDPKFSTIAAFSRYFGVPTDYFLSGNPDLRIESEVGQSVLHRRTAAAYTAAMHEVQMDMMRQGYHVGTEQVLDWLHAEGNVLTNFDAIRDQVDLFVPYEPGDSMLKPYKIGMESLCTRVLGLSNEDHFLKEIGKFDSKCIESILCAHDKVKTVPYIVSTETRVVVHDDNSYELVPYRRIITRVTEPNGQPFNLVHSKRLPAPAQADFQLTTDAKSGIALS